MESKQELLISIKSIISTYVLMNNLKSLTNESQLNDVKKLIYKRHIGQFESDIIEETILTALEEEYNVLTKKLIGYPYLAGLYSDTNDLLQIIWVLDNKTGIVLHNVDSVSPQKFGTILPRLNEKLYKPYNKLFLMWNDGVMIPDHIKEYIERQ